MATQASIVISHPTGNQNFRQASLALAEQDWLREVWTTVAWSSPRGITRLLPAGLRATLERRSYPAALSPILRTHPWREVVRLIAERGRLDALTRHETGWGSVDRVYQSLDRRVAKRLGELEGIEAVYAYEDGALETFRAAKKLGLRCLYELPIGYYRSAQTIFTEEATLQPAWAMTLGGLLDSPQKVARKDEELALADDIIVASSFTRASLSLSAGDCVARSRVIGYGAPESPRVRRSGASRGRRLKAIYVGSLGQRKGISYLFEALAAIAPHVELTVIGRRASLACAALDRALSQHRWIETLPHSAVLQEMAEHDVLILPSLFEGFGLVLLEAMAAGLPVIATPHTAAADLVEDGRNGYLVPIRSAEAIAGRLEQLAGQPDLVDALSEGARATAALHGWERYRRALAGLI